MDALHGRGFLDFPALHPRIAPVASDPRVAVSLARMAATLEARLSAIPEPRQTELYRLAEAQAEQGRTSEGIATLERAIALGGPHTEELRALLRRTRARLEREEPRPPAEGPR